MPMVTIASMLALAYVMNYSGMTSTLGLALAATGFAFPFFSAVLGWLAVFLTGSDTSANALFGNLQVVTANALGLNPILTASVNSAAGVMGKMISPLSIAVAVAATGMTTADESRLFRFTIKHSILLMVAMGIISMLFAYVFPGSGADSEVIMDAQREAWGLSPGAWGLTALTLLAAACSVSAPESQQKPAARCGGAGRSDGRPWRSPASDLDEESRGAAVLRPWICAGVRVQSRRSRAVVPAGRGARSGAAMPHWGIAWALGPNYNLDIDDPRAKQAYEAIEKARTLAKAGPAVEREYIEAMAVRYSANPKPIVRRWRKRTARRWAR